MKGSEATLCIERSGIATSTQTCDVLIFSMRGSRSSSLRLPVHFILLVFLLILLLLLFVLLFVLLFSYYTTSSSPASSSSSSSSFSSTCAFSSPSSYLLCFLLPLILGKMRRHRLACGSFPDCVLQGSSADNSPGNFFQYRPEGTRSVRNTAETSH